jgi:hypothetical protein
VRSENGFVQSDHCFVPALSTKRTIYQVNSNDYDKGGPALADPWLNRQPFVPAAKVETLSGLTLLNAWPAA